MIPPVARRFVAGEDAESALAYVEEQNTHNIACMLNLLGEHYHEREPADSDTDAYLDLLDRIADMGADACLSVKPSQLGLFVDEEVFRENLGRIMSAAEEYGILVWLDMEDSSTTEVTVSAYEHHVQDTDNIGVCLQANLQRTRDDLERLLDTTGHIRLVKGAYSESRDIAHSKKSVVDENYKQYMATLFANFSGRIALGTHDPDMIHLSHALAEEHNRDFEHQMLMGVRTTAQRRLSWQYPVTQYVPYGGKWFSYFYRRIRERKENALFAARAIVQG